MTEDKKTPLSSVKHEIPEGFWVGCGCDQCREVGDILCKVGPVMSKMIDELRETNHGLVSGAIEQLLDVIAMLATVHISGVMQVSDALYTISSYLRERGREVQLRSVVGGEVERIFKRMMRPIGSVAIGQGDEMPPGFPQPGCVFCPGKGDKDGGDGGGGLH